MTIAGHAVPQFTAQSVLPQPCMSWPIVDEADVAGIGQLDPEMANAGPDANAKDSASQIKANSRCIAPE